MSIWSEAPRIQAPPSDPAQLLSYVKGLANTTAKMAKDLEFILNGNIAFDNIRAESIETQNLKAGAVTAEKITVEELSAISADLGHITAGLIESIRIFGSYIATRDGAYPRAEMSNTGDLFASYYNASNYIAIQADYFGVPSLNFFHSGNLKGRLDTISSLLEVVGLGGLVLLASGGDLQLEATGVVKVQSWNKFYNDATNRTLQQDLNSIDNNIIALSSLYDSLNTRVTALENP